MKEDNKVNFLDLMLNKEKIRYLSNPQLEYLLSTEEPFKATFDLLKQELIQRIKNKIYDCKKYELKNNRKRVIREDAIEILKNNNIDTNKVLEYKLKKISDLEKILDEDIFNKIYDVKEYKPFLLKKN